MEILSKERRSKIIDHMVEEYKEDFYSQWVMPWQENMTIEEYLIDFMESNNFFKDWLFVEYLEDNKKYICCIIDFATSKGLDYLDILTYEVDENYNVLDFVFKEYK